MNAKRLLSAAFKIERIIWTSPAQTVVGRWIVQEGESTNRWILAVAERH
jgi:hypothetical protein